MYKGTRIVLSLLLATILIAGVAGCGSGSGNSASTPANPASSDSTPADPAPVDSTPDDSAPVDSAPVQLQNYSVGTASTGGLMYAIGAGWATIINNTMTDQYHLTAEVTAGNMENIAMLEDGTVEFCTNGVMSVAEGYAGEAQWTGGTKYSKLRAMFPMNPMMLTAITLKGSGITTLADLNGKVVGLGSKGGAIDGVMSVVLANRGIKPSQVHNDGWSASVTALTDGQIDALITMQMAPAPSIVELQASKDVVFITFSPEDLAAVSEAIPSMADSAIPANSYNGVTEDIPTKSDWAIMCASVDMPEDVVYNLVKATFENVEDMKLLHQACANISPELAKEVKIPFHPGAVRYYKEIGIELPEPSVNPAG